MPLGGALRGTLPNPTLSDDASSAIARQVFGPRRIRPLDPQAGAGVTITPDAMGVPIASPPEDVSSTIARGLFQPKPPMAAPPFRRINTTLPLSGGSDLISDITLNISQFSTFLPGVVPSSGVSSGRFA